MKVLKLDNGLRVVLESRKGVGLTAINVAINAGYAYENKENYGASILVSSTISKATKSFSKQNILDMTEGEGGSLNPSYDTESSSISMEFHSENIEKQLQVLSSILTEPLFDVEEIEKQKKSAKERIKSMQDHPTSYINVKLDDIAFSGQVYGNSLLSQYDVIDNLTRETIVDFYSSRYTAKNMVVSIVGDIDIDVVKVACKKYFSNIASGKVVELPKANPQPFYFVKEDDAAEQVNLKMCFPGVGWDSPDYLTYKMLIATVTGGLSSRMFKAMREEDQLVYSFNLNNVPLYGGGIFCMNAGTGKGKTKLLITKAINEMKKFIETISSEEVESTLNSWEKRFKTNLYDIATASILHSHEMLKKGSLETSATLQEKLKKITKEDLIRVANSIISSEVSFIAVAPKGEVLSLEEIDTIRKGIVSELDIQKAKDRALKTSINPRWIKLLKGDGQYGEYKKSVLANGLTVISQYRADTLVACGYWAGTGSENETLEENGISHMLEHMVFKGTKSYKTGEVDNLIENKLSGYLNAFTSECKTCYYSYNIAPEDVYKASHALGELVFYPALSDIDFNGGTKEDGVIVKDGEKEVVFEEINRANDTPVHILFNSMMKGAFGNTALGRKILGTKKSLTPMTGDTLRQYHDKWYVPNNMTYIAIGDVNHEELVKEMDSMWGDIPAREFDSSHNWKYIGENESVNFPGKEMSFLAITFNAVPQSDEKSIQYDLLSVILGQGNSSKLYKHIVEEKQLASSIHANTDLMKNAGLFYISTNCNHDNVQKIKDEVLSLLKNTVIIEKDLKSAVLSIKSDKKAKLLSPSDTFVDLGYNYTNTGLIETVEDMENKLNDVSVTDLNNLIKEVVSSKVSISIVGKLD